VNVRETLREAVEIALRRHPIFDRTDEESESGPIAGKVLMAAVALGIAAAATAVFAPPEINPFKDQPQPAYVADLDRDLQGDKKLDRLISLAGGFKRLSSHALLAESAERSAAEHQPPDVASPDDGSTAPSELAQAATDSDEATDVSPETDRTHDATAPAASPGGEDPPPKPPTTVSPASPHEDEADDSPCTATGSAGCPSSLGDAPDGDDDGLVNAIGAVIDYLLPG
jgi:hypothetical protein